MIPKFRAFANGYMFEVTELVWKNGKIKWIRGILPDGSFIGGHADYMDITKIKLMQFTGLHDKNGKENYHKDILKWKNYHFVIEWNDNNGCWYGKPFFSNDIRGILYVSCFSQSENIGNIHENPALLEAHNGDNT